MVQLRPTTTDPSADALKAVLEKSRLGRAPNPTMPPAAVQRKASMPLSAALSPTIANPSEETSYATLPNPSPGKSPNPTMPPVAV